MLPGCTTSLQQDAVNYANERENGSTAVYAWGSGLNCQLVIYGAICGPFQYAKMRRHKDGVIASVNIYIYLSGYFESSQMIK